MAATVGTSDSAKRMLRDLFADELWFKYVMFGHLAEREEATDVKEKACQ